MALKKIFADFNNADTRGRVRLITDGSLEDISKYNIILKEALELLLNDNDGLETLGIVEFSQEEKIWVARIDWDSFK